MTFKMQFWMEVVPNPNQKQITQCKLCMYCFVAIICIVVIFAHKAKYAVNSITLTGLCSVFNIL